MKPLGILILATLCLIPAVSAVAAEPDDRDFYGTTSCMGCHGVSAMGGLGPPLAKTKIKIETYTRIVREGKGMMPGTPASELSDEDLAGIYRQLQSMDWKESEIPLSYRIGALLTTRNVARIFLIVFAISAVFAIRGWVKWIRMAGLGHLMPSIRRYGLGRSLGVAIKSLFLDGLLVQSLWRRSKHRWFMHALMLYGMLSLVLADILMQIYNPSRADLALTNPLKLLPIIAGLAVLMGILYVMKRYKTDEYIDNGLTLGQDYLFVTLLFHTVLSGILTLVINRSTAFSWVMPIYIYHLASIAALIISAPFTRFQHAWIAPTMIALTRVTEAISSSGVDINMQREPSPGRHHKSLQIAEDVVKRIAPELARNVKIRYYP